MKSKKVIQFPNLEEKLLQKAKEAILEKQFKEAILYFKQLLEINQTCEEAYLGLTIMYVESGQLMQAKALCEQMLNDHIGNEYEVIHMYLSILIQLKHFNEANAFLLMLERQNQTLFYSDDSFIHIKDFCQKQQSDHEEQEDEEHLKEWIKALKSNDENTRYHALKQLLHVQSESFYERLKPLLADDEVDPIVKTILLEWLIERVPKDIITIRKFHQTMEIRGEDVRPIEEYSLAKEVTGCLENVLEQENPTLLAIAKDLWKRLLLMYYPFPLTPSDPALWAASMHILGLEMSGMTQINDRILSIYKVEKKPLDQLVQSILKLDLTGYR